jgi:hypothetical protein
MKIPALTVEKRETPLLYQQLESDSKLLGAGLKADDEKPPLKSPVIRLLTLK